MSVTTMGPGSRGVDPHSPSACGRASGPPPTLPAVPAEIEPPELARLVDVAECPRVDDWSLRSALVRYAQPQPRRASVILGLVRRIDAALHPQAKLLRAEGPAIWAALRDGGGPTSGPAGFVVAVLRVSALLDRLGETLAAWAVDPSAPRPDAEVDTVTAEVARQLDAIGVPPEGDRPVPPGARRRG